MDEKTFRAIKKYVENYLDMCADERISINYRFTNYSTLKTIEIVFNTGMIESNYIKTLSALADLGNLGFNIENRDKKLIFSIY